MTVPDPDLPYPLPGHGRMVFRKPVPQHCLAERAAAIPDLVFGRPERLMVE